jgi:diguanylate cyclase (GGDEF)-like protein/PAS domain S-box-containing protein
MVPPDGFAGHWISPFRCKAHTNSVGSAERPMYRRMKLRPLTDPEEIEFRARDVVIGGVLGVATAVAVVTYLALGSSSPHRELLIWICGGWVIVGCGLFALPRRRLVASRAREPFFLLWSSSVIASIAAGIVIEGRSGTPIMAGFLLPLVFAAISYPVLLTAIVGSITLTAAASAGTWIGQPLADTMFQVLMLGFAAVMGVWQAFGRERRAEQLAAEHGRAQRYLDVAGTMIVVLDARGVVQQINRRGCEILGYSEAELTGRDWFEVAVPDAVRESTREIYVRTLAGFRPEAPPELESPVLTRTGECRWVAWTGRIVPTGDGDGMLIAGEDVTERRAAQEHVLYMAYHDGLTGLANRARLEEHVTLAMARAVRHDLAAAVLYIDLDHFKVVNDTLGHAAGDEVLRQVAGRLTGRCRSTDLLARHGGDEFMLLLADIDGDARAAAHRVAGDLLNLLKPPFAIEDQEFEIAASIGVALFPAHGETMTDLLKHADAALYEAKRDGRGTIRFAPPLLSAQAGA